MLSILGLVRWPLVLTKHGMSIETYAGGPSYGTEMRYAYDMSVDGRKLLCGSYLK